ncbi:MAG: hypothetical protein ACRCVA_15650, partial [Phreatobacter sp.]
MTSAPDRVPRKLNLDHLKKQAKELIRLHRAGDAGAMARFRQGLPAAAGLGDAAISDLGLRLHDAQSCLAREHGFLSWSDLKGYVEVQSAIAGERAALARRWLGLVYSGDVGGTNDRANPRVAARLLAENPGLATESPYLACAAGNDALLRQAIAADPAWVNRPGGPLNLPPLVAVAQSGLLQLDAFRDGLRRCARALLAAGADPNQRIDSRWPPASLDKPDPRYPLSALYGAAGNNRDAVLTEMLLAAGADPNDNESLYHSLENLACTRLLLDHGARIAGTNALYRALDLDDPAPLQLLLR